MYIFNQENEYKNGIISKGKRMIKQKFFLLSTYKDFVNYFYLVVITLCDCFKLLKTK